MASFVDELPAEQKRLINRLRKIIRDEDRAVKEVPGSIMRSKNALCYKQQDVMKYGLAQTSRGFSFHSMVMYANADVFDFAKTHLRYVKFQKGCLNIFSLENFDFKAFEEMLQFSADKDFGPVIAHYKEIKRK